MPIAYTPNCIHISAIVRTNCRVSRREDLQIPIWRVVGLIKDLLWQEGKRRSLKAGRHDADIALYDFFMAWASLWNVLRAGVESNTRLSEALDVAAEPLRFSRSDEVEYTAINHWSFSEQTLPRTFRRCDILKITVKEDAK